VKTGHSRVSGPFRDRPYYEVTDVERICGDALRSVGLMPLGPEPIRIERFVEKRFKISPQYEPLPPGILGYTLFASTGPAAMIVARDLVDANTSTAERRINTTLAHEAGHCLLHSRLFAVADAGPELFRDDQVSPSKAKILCRDTPVGAYDGKWWEYQANLAIGALLLPSDLVRTAVTPWLETTGLLKLPKLSRSGRIAATQHLSRVFEVNPIAARIRLEELFPNSLQQTL
jgi:hypothetical protein